MDETVKRVSKQRRPLPKKSTTPPERELKGQSEKAATFKQTIYPYRTTGRHIIALAEQRAREKESDLYREAVDIGSLFLSIDGEPGPDGRYGTLSVEDLARRLRPKVVVALDWLAQQGYPVQTGGFSGMEAFLGLLQQGVISSPVPVAASPPAAVAADLTELPDVMLSESALTALGIEEEDGFL